ncbi:MAG: hypothetical protein C4555_06445 [Dehalococcoidia bacterium]|nr:MAG: hypothetical protein C4555_06445 [Dehalococcoidia bacterium]
MPGTTTIKFIRNFSMRQLQWISNIVDLYKCLADAMRWPDAARTQEDVIYEALEIGLSRLQANLEKELEARGALAPKKRAGRPRKGEESSNSQST